MTQRTRGKETKDDLLFGKQKAKENLSRAVKDLSYLLSRAYGIKSACDIVGNRYRLNTRQQKALRGMSAADNFVLIRKQKERTINELKDATVYIDGFNLLIILESLMSGAYIFKGVDNCFRDLSSVYGSYKTIVYTEYIIKLIGESFHKLQVKKVIWVLDKPVSNSGKLKTLLSDMVTKNNFDWDIVLAFNPDKFLVEQNGIVISSDAWILNNCTSWFNMVAYLLAKKLVHSEFVFSSK